MVAAFSIVFVGVLGTFVLRSCRGTQETPSNTSGAADAKQAVQDKKSYTDINLLMVGDILFHYQVRQSGLLSDGTRNYDHVFAHFLKELKDKDIAVVNQETPLGGPEIGGDAPDGYGSYPMFNGPQEMGDAEAKAGFNVILRATNHAMDAGYEGLSSEMQFWETKHPNVHVIGAVDPESTTDSVEDVYFFTKGDFTVALLNYTFDLNGIADPRGVVSILEEQHIHSTMAAARQKADMIVVFPHWGVEYETTPNEEQRAWADLFVEEGADVIIGNHPHVMQPVEVLEGEKGNLVPCYWSTGNFISTSPDNMSLLGGVPELTLRKTNDGTCTIESAKLKVVVTHLGEHEDMTTYLLKDWTDELAATNKIDTEMNPNTDNSTLTPEWAADFCTEVLGSDYDVKSGTLTVDLNAIPKKRNAKASGRSSSTANDSSSDGGTSDAGSTGGAASKSSRSSSDADDEGGADGSGASSSGGSGYADGTSTGSASGSGGSGYADGTGYADGSSDNTSGTYSTSDAYGTSDVYGTSDAYGAGTGSVGGSGSSSGAYGTV